MSEPTPSGLSEPEQAVSVELPWRRLHPLSPLLRGGLALLVIAGVLFANLRDRLIDLVITDRYPVDGMPGESGDAIDLIEYLAEQHMLLWAVGTVLAVVLLVIGFAWLSWRFASFRITLEAVESRRGVIFTQHRRAPLERIQSVNLQRSLLARIFGLTQVDVQTAGQDGKVSLQYLAHREAKQVREQILLAVQSTRKHSVTSAPQVDAVSPQSHAGVAVDYAGRAYASTGSSLDAHLRNMTDFDIDPTAGAQGQLVKVPLGRLVGSILLSTDTLATLISGTIIATVSIWVSPFMLLTLAPVVLIYVGLLITQFNRGFNFVLSRAEDGVRIGAGFTSITTETIPFGRVHAVQALQPIGWRPFGWWKVRITTAGHSMSQGGQNKLQNIVLPVGKVDDVLRAFELLLPPQATAEEQQVQALRRALAGPHEGFLRAGAAAAWVLWFGRRWAGLRIADPDTEWASLQITRGVLTRSLSLMPVLRAQSIMLSRPMVHRMLGLASLQAHTVLGQVRVGMRGIDLRDARHTFDALAATVVRVQNEEKARRVGEVAG